MPRAMTEDELRDLILDHMREVCDYWETVESRYHKTTGDRIRGAVFSILATLDGDSPGIPAFDLVAKTHPSDKSFHIDNGDDWIEDGTTISTALHEFWHKKPEGHL